MTEPTEKSFLTNPNQEPGKKDSERKNAMGGIALSETLLGLSIANFYDASSHFMRSDGHSSEIVISLQTADEKDTEHKVVGTGDSYDSALLNSLHRMNELETVSSRDLIRIEMTNSTFVSFTKFDNYRPKIAPKQDIYEIPDYINEELMASDDMLCSTYLNTLKEEGWQNKLSNLLYSYLNQDSDGQKLKNDLKINSLKNLTPEQAVKVSAAFVQNVSKYSNEDIGSDGPTRADESNTHDLLQEGIANKKNNNWNGNGVCRNIASNIKSVFESLKSTQDNLSMLNNTYCVYNTGADGSGYKDSRKDDNEKYNILNPNRRRQGHAWNSFITIDSKGSTTATVIDATWALDKDIDEAVRHLDYTEARTTAQMFQLFEKSEVKIEAFDSLTDYINKLIRRNYCNDQLDKNTLKNSREYATTEYLKVAANLSEIPEDFEAPSQVFRCAKEMSGKLDCQEITTLFALNKASSTQRNGVIKLIIADNHKNQEKILPKWKIADNLIFPDDELQQLAFEAVDGNDKHIEGLAEQSGRFRFRLRELRPGRLPSFDEKRPADLLEFRYLSEQNGVHATESKQIMREHKNRLKKLTPNDSIYHAITFGRSDYNLVKNFSKIKSALLGNDK